MAPINVMLSLQSRHCKAIVEDQADKNIDGAILGKPEAQRRTPYVELIEKIAEQNARAKRRYKPDE